MRHRILSYAMYGNVLAKNFEQKILADGGDRVNNIRADGIVDDDWLCY